ncbi:MAG: S8 family serine peptidase [Chloroflexi bacterium]|nr:S8 family serine peptidase [Chloroflexota bacterium]
MKTNRLGQIIALLALILIALTAGAQPIGKQPSPPPEPVFAELPGLSTGTAVYIVRLENEPLATYRGGVAGLAATTPSSTGERKLNLQSPASVAYQNYLENRQTQLIADFSRQLERDPKILHQYTVAFNGIALELDGAEAAQLAAFPDVLTVRRDRDYELLTDVGPAWIDAPAIWKGGAAIQNKGEGIIIGVIDTGINIDHPSFADVGGDGYDHSNPLGVHLGWCHPAHPDHNAAYVCNDKLIGMWDFADAHGESGGPEDSHGHGSHTASTAAGNIISATLTTTTGYAYTASISGVAPHANIIAYDACVASCPGAALLAAVNQAVIDGVHVINYSITGGSDPYNDGVELAFLAANEAGVFVSAAAGNSGPGASTLSHQSPWVTTVGASTHNRYFGSNLVNFSGGDSALTDIAGKSVTGDYGPAPIVYAGDFGDALCLAPFPAETWTDGEIVVCDRGTITRVSKGSNVQAGGAGGLVLANANAGQVLNADSHYLPAVHVNYADGAMLKAWLSNGSGHTATIAGTNADFDAANGDIMASFSSRGPNSAFDVLKPDIVGPGVDVLATKHTTDPQNDPEYGLDSGTSMAAPHLAGAAALLLGAHPGWSPDEIRSAMMMTAVPDILLENGSSPANPFARGAGRVDLGQAVQAGLVMDETKANYDAANPDLGGDPKTLNLPSLTDSDCFLSCSWTRTVKSSLTASTMWTVAVDAPAGMDITVTPDSFSIPAGMTRTLDISVDITYFDGSQGWGFATLTFSSPGQADLYMPIVVQKSYSDNPAALRKTAPAIAEPGQIITYEIALDNLDAISHTFSLTDTLPAGLEYVPGSATNGLVYDNSARQFTWSGEMGPGTLGYEVTAVDSPTYSNLGGIGGTNLCDDPALQGDCDDGSVAFNLADSHSVSYTFYGETLTQTFAMTNGFLYGPEGWLGSACSACPQSFPEPTELNQVIAGLWRDVDMSSGVGEWYAAVVSAFLDNPADRVFYINWHNAGQFGAPLTTSRNAIAIVLDGPLQSEPAGRIYFIYDDLSETAVLDTQGYAIGVENKDGTEGLTHAFRPCPSSSCIDGADVGSLPKNGTTLQLDPAIVGGSSAKIFTYQVEVTAAAKTQITNIVEATGDGPDTHLSALADLLVEYRIYLPVVRK